jgi:hypothetical protein
MKRRERPRQPRPVVAWYRASLEADPLLDHNDNMTSEETKWQRVEQEWERIMRDLRKKAIHDLVHDGTLSDRDTEFYRIVLTQTGSKS